MICFNPSQHLSSFSEEIPLPPLFKDPIRLPDHFDRLENLGPHGNDPVADHLDLFGGNHAQVEDASLGIGTAIVDPDDDAFAIFQVGDPDHRVEGELLMRSRAISRMVMLPVGGESTDPAAPVKGGLPAFHGQRLRVIEGGTGRSRLKRAASRGKECHERSPQKGGKAGRGEKAHPSIKPREPSGGKLSGRNIKPRLCSGDHANRTAASPRWNAVFRLKMLER